jgi:hypothetical protein
MLCAVGDANTNQTPNCSDFERETPCATPDKEIAGFWAANHLLWPSWANHFEPRHRDQIVMPPRTRTTHAPPPPTASPERRPRFGAIGEGRRNWSYDLEVALSLYLRQAVSGMQLDAGQHSSAPMGEGSGEGHVAKSQVEDAWRTHRARWSVARGTRPLQPAALYIPPHLSAGSPSPHSTNAHTRPPSRPLEASDPGESVARRTRAISTSTNSTKRAA